MKPTVMKHKCVACGECTLNCPEGAINISSTTGKAYINYKKCTGCKTCIGACPVKAIKD